MLFPVLGCQFHICGHTEKKMKTEIIFDKRNSVDLSILSAGWSSG